MYSIFLFSVSLGGSGLSPAFACFHLFPVQFSLLILLPFLGFDDFSLVFAYAFAYSLLFP
jgi:hypothetical protein